MEKVNKVLVIFLLLILLVIVLYLILYTITRFTSYTIIDISDKENCIRTQDIELYINSDNPSEVITTISLKRYLDIIKIKNCFKYDTECLKLGINKFPSYKINDKIIEQDLTEEELVNFAGCD